MLPWKQHVVCRAPNKALHSDGGVGLVVGTSTTASHGFSTPSTLPGKFYWARRVRRYAPMAPRTLRIRRSWLSWRPNIPRGRRKSLPTSSTWPADRSRNLRRSSARPSANFRHTVLVDRTAFGTSIFACSPRNLGTTKRGRCPGQALCQRSDAGLVQQVSRGGPDFMPCSRRSPWRESQSKFEVGCGACYRWAATMGGRRRWR